MQETFELQFFHDLRPFRSETFLEQLRVLFHVGHFGMETVEPLVGLVDALSDGSYGIGCGDEFGVVFVDECLHGGV